MSLQSIFESGFRLINGDTLNSALSYPKVAYKDGITAGAASTVATSPVLTETANLVETVASAGDGVSLPAAVAGMIKYVSNAGGNNMTVFALGGSTIDGTAGATGVTQNDGVDNIYVSPKNGVWRQF